VTNSNSVWDRLDELDDRELNRLVEAATEVLAEHEGSGFNGLPPGVLGDELRRAFADDGVTIGQEAAHRLVYGGDQEAIVRPVLMQLGREPAIAEEIAEAYEARRRMMMVDPASIAAGALLLLVLKLRRVRVEKGIVEVDFYEASKTALEAARSYLGQ
jgi:hypothetical protein